MIPLKLSKNLKRGDSDSEVVLLQQTLNDLGFTVATSGPGSVGNETSIFDSNTERALIAYQDSQSASGLIPSGILDNVTIVLMNRDVERIATGQEVPPTSAPTDATSPVQQGIISIISAHIGSLINSFIKFISNIF